MGNQNCSQLYSDNLQNQSYGDYKFIKQGCKTLVLIQKDLQTDQQLIRQVKSKLQLRFKFKSNHLVKLLNYHLDFNKYSTHVKLYYQFISKTLKDRFKQKSQLNQEFTERELFNIIYGVEDALFQLKKNNILHGCINLGTILCQNNFYKITDVSSTTCKFCSILDVKSYELVRRGCRQQFLSPKLLTNLEYRSLEPYYEIDDDFFSLGMIILSVACGMGSISFYNWKQKQCTGEIRWQVVQSSIRYIERNFSSKLSKKVKELIGFKEQMNKSIQTNQTTIQNNSTQNHNMGQITQSINQLDKDIDRILSKINITSLDEKSTSEKVNLEKQKQFKKLK